jgi:hypothetical protein
MWGEPAVQRRLDVQVQPLFRGEQPPPVPDGLRLPVPVVAGDHAVQREYCEAKEQLGDDPWPVPVAPVDPGRLQRHPSLLARHLSDSPPSPCRGSTNHRGCP